jgi:hypothetical protein
MRVALDSSHPRLFWVTSETEGEDSYIVDLCANELGIDQDGNMIFNGKCGGPNGERGCKDYYYRCGPSLKKPENAGKVYRCKHIRSARDYALNLLLPHIKKTDPNIEEEFQT